MTDIIAAWISKWESTIGLPPIYTDEVPNQSVQVYAVLTMSLDRPSQHFTTFRRDWYRAVVELYSRDSTKTNSVGLQELISETFDDPERLMFPARTHCLTREQELSEKPDPTRPDLRIGVQAFTITTMRTR